MGNKPTRPPLTFDEWVEHFLPKGCHVRIINHIHQGWKAYRDYGPAFDRQCVCDDEISSPMLVEVCNHCGRSIPLKKVSMSTSKEEIKIRIGGEADAL